VVGRNPSGKGQDGCPIQDMGMTVGVGLMVYWAMVTTTNVGSGENGYRGVRGRWKPEMR